ncbi:adenosine deaminase [Arenicella xantha]|uniref:Adenine deaminase n=1 Tax=Arenicella xantha TaxID=644221 RepID=A0A395JRF3_9GAMM|nr:adenosine deaminase [Arenicella xantha]RBP53036.1 adenosine deaminase [Arenicella xantha]
MSSDEFINWLKRVPKAELHLHIDGSMQPKRMLSLAKKNGISLPYDSLDAVQAAYAFEDLQSFLDLYYLGASVLLEEDDFFHLMMDYLLKCREQNIVHAEIMIEPQTYAPNGVSFATMMSGFKRAIKQAHDQWGQSVILILSFLRHLSEQDALEMLEQATDFRDDLMAIGLASSELGNPPQKFSQLYQEAARLGFRLSAHAGEEGPADFIWQALKGLDVERIDHGVRCVDDPELVDFLCERQIPLTVCPLSNTKLRVFETMHQHTVLSLLDRGLCVTINSDDPAYFGGYLNENYIALHEHLGMNQAQALRLVENSFKASFLSPERKQAFIKQVHATE